MYQPVERTKSVALLVETISDDPTLRFLPPLCSVTVDSSTDACRASTNRPKLPIRSPNPPFPDTPPLKGQISAREKADGLAQENDESWINGGSIDSCGGGKRWTFVASSSCIRWSLSLSALSWDLYIYIIIIIILDDFWWRKKKMCEALGSMAGLLKVAIDRDRGSVRREKDRGASSTLRKGWQWRR